MITSVQQRVRVVPPEYDIAAVDRRLEPLRQQLADAPPDSEQARDLAVAVDAVTAWRGSVEASIEALGRPVPVYWIKPPSVFDLEEIRARLAERGAVNVPSDGTILAAAGEIVEQLVEIGHDRAAEFQDLINLAMGEMATLGGVTPGIGGRLETLYLHLSVFDDFGALMGQRRRWFGLMPLIAAQAHLVGWENVVDREDPAKPLDFRRGPVGVPEALLDRIDRAQLRSVGQRVWSAGHVSEGDAKN